MASLLPLLVLLSRSPSTLLLLKGGGPLGFHPISGTGRALVAVCALPPIPVQAQAVMEALLALVPASRADSGDSKNGNA